MIDAYQSTSIGEVASRLARVPRFNGQTITEWTVLHHIMAGYWFCKDELGEDPMTILMWLLHDVEEAWVGDTPMPFKTNEQAELGDEVRRDIFKALDAPYDEAKLKQTHTQIDRPMAAGEASLVCEPEYRKLFDENTIDRTAGYAWEIIDVPATMLVQPYIALVEEALDHPKVRALRRLL